MKCVKILPSVLKGQISPPPSKSISHRLLISAGLAEGKSILKNIAFSEDIQATIRGMTALGADVKYLSSSFDKKHIDLAVTGCWPLKVKRETIDCGESGSTLRFLIPVALLSERSMTFTGRGRLSKRPLDVYFSAFDRQGIEYSVGKDVLPLEISGRLKPGRFYIRGDVSSQFVSGLLFALPLLDGDSEIIITAPLESKGYVDITLDVLNKFSIQVENQDYKVFYIKGNQAYRPAKFKVEGDYSQGAFWLVAGILSGEITCLDLSPDSVQGDRVILKILEKMGAKIQKGDKFINAVKMQTRGITIDVSQCPDLVPPVAALAALSPGTTRIVNGRRLKIKESDRLKAISTEFAKLGAKISLLSDGLKIQGSPVLEGGTVVDSWNDHRIAMALAVAALGCKKPVVIKRSDAVNKSYPAFWEDFKRLGGIIDEFDLRQQI